MQPELKKDFDSLLKRIGYNDQTVIEMYIREHENDIREATRALVAAENNNNVARSEDGRTHHRLAHRGNHSDIAR